MNDTMPALAVPGDAKDLLPPDPQTQTGLAIEAYALFDRLTATAEAQRLRPTLKAVFGSRPPPSVTEGVLRIAVGRIRRTFPLTAFLAEGPTVATTNHDRLQQLRAWTFTAALDAVAAGRASHSTWRWAVRAVRRACTLEGLEDARIRLPVGADSDLQATRGAVEAWIVREREAGAPFATRLEDVARVLAQLDGRPRRVIAKRQEGRRARSARVLSAFEHAARSAPSADGSGSTPIIAAPTDLGLPSGFNLDTDDLLDTEEVADIARPILLRSVIDAPDLDEAEREAAALLQNPADEVEAPATLASRHLTRDEARALAAALREAVRIRHVAPGVVLLAVSLLTGRRIGALCEIEAAVPYAPGAPWWHRGGDGIALAIAPAVTDARPPPARGFALRLPDWLQAPLAAVLDTGMPDADMAVEQARAWLASRPSGRRQRTSRLAGALVHGLRAAGTDGVIAAHLAGQDPPHVPAMYYAALPVDLLDRAWRGWIGDWLGLRAQGAAVVLTGQDTTVGSRRVPPDATVTGLCAARRAAQAEARALRARGDPVAAIEMHGAFVLHAGLILAFALGLRPHGDACPPLSRMLEVGPHPSALITDKGNRCVDDSRWLPLPRIVRTTLEAIRTQLGHVHAWGRAFNPAAARAAEAALAGVDSPLWFLPLTGAPTPLAARDLWSRLDPAPHPRNLARHYWRTAFLRDGLPGWMADAWMGHGGWEAAQTLPVAGFGAGDLAPVAALIDRRVEPLGLVPPKAERLL